MHCLYLSYPARVAEWGRSTGGPALSREAPVAVSLGGHRVGAKEGSRGRCRLPRGMANGAPGQPRSRGYRARPRPAGVGAGPTPLGEPRLAPTSPGTGRRGVPAALTSLRGSRASVCRNLDALKRFMVRRDRRAAPRRPQPRPAPPRGTARAGQGAAGPLCAARVGGSAGRQLSALAEPAALGAWQQLLHAQHGGTSGGCRSAPGSEHNRSCQGSGRRAPRPAVSPTGRPRRRRRAGGAARIPHSARSAASVLPRTAELSPRCARRLKEPRPPMAARSSGSSEAGNRRGPRPGPGGTEDQSRVQ